MQIAPPVSSTSNGKLRADEMAGRYTFGVWDRDGRRVSLVVGEDGIDLDHTLYSYSELHRWSHNEDYLNLLLPGEPSTDVELRAASSTEAEGIVSAIGAHRPCHRRKHF
jgi:hypothetical protein